MYEQQLDLFSSADIQADRPLPLSVELCPAATVLDDQALIAAIPDSNLADSIALAAEAGTRFSRKSNMWAWRLVTRTTQGCMRVLRKGAAIGAG